MCYCFHFIEEETETWQTQNLNRDVTETKTQSLSIMENISPFKISKLRPRSFKVNKRQKIALQNLCTKKGKE